MTAQCHLLENMPLLQCCYKDHR